MSTQEFIDQLPHEKRETFIRAIDFIVKSGFLDFHAQKLSKRVIDTSFVFANDSGDDSLENMRHVAIELSTFVAFGTEIEEFLNPKGEAEK